MMAIGEYVQLKEVEVSGIQTPGDNLKVGEVVSIGEKCSRYVYEEKSDSFTSGGSSSFRSSGWYLKEGMKENFVAFSEGSKVLFDTNKSLKYGGLWYLKADSIFAFEEKE